MAGPMDVAPKDCSWAAMTALTTDEMTVSTMAAARAVSSAETMAALWVDTMAVSSAVMTVASRAD